MNRARHAVEFHVSRKRGVERVREGLPELFSQGRLDDGDPPGDLLRFVAGHKGTALAAVNYT